MQGNGILTGQPNAAAANCAGSSDEHFKRKNDEKKF